MYYKMIRHSVTRRHWFGRFPNLRSRLLELMLWKLAINLFPLFVAPCIAWKSRVRRVSDTEISSVRISRKAYAVNDQIHITGDFITPNVVIPTVEICTLETRQTRATAIAKSILFEYARHQMYNISYYSSPDELELSTSYHHPKWLKYHVLLHRLKVKHQQLKHATGTANWATNHWIFWFDADVLLTNKTEKLESLVQAWAEESTMLLFSRDPFSRKQGRKRTPINVGVIGVRASEWSRSFLELCIARGPSVTTKQIGNRWSPGLVDQPRVTYLLHQLGEFVDDISAEIAISSHVTIVPLRNLQSICRWGYKDRKEVHWQMGDFSAHVSGMSKMPIYREKVMVLLAEYSNGSIAAGKVAENVCRHGFR